MLVGLCLSYLPKQFKGDMSIFSLVGVGGSADNRRQTIRLDRLVYIKIYGVTDVFVDSTDFHDDDDISKSIMNKYPTLQHTKPYIFQVFAISS